MLVFLLVLSALVLVPVFSLAEDRMSRINRQVSDSAFEMLNLLFKSGDASAESVSLIHLYYDILFSATQAEVPLASYDRRHSGEAKEKVMELEYRAMDDRFDNDMLFWEQYLNGELSGEEYIAEIKKLYGFFLEESR